MRGCRGLTGVGLSSGRRCIVGRVCARLVLSVQVLVPSRCPRRESNSHGVGPGGILRSLPPPGHHQPPTTRCVHLPRFHHFGGLACPRWFVVVVRAQSCSKVLHTNCYSPELDRAVLLHLELCRMLAISVARLK